MIRQVAVGRRPKEELPRSHPGQAASYPRKRRNQANNRARIARMAVEYGVTEGQVRQYLYDEVAAIRRRRPDAPAPFVAAPPSARRETERGTINWDGYSKR